MKDYANFDRISQIEYNIIGLDIQIKDLRERIHEIEKAVYLEVEHAYEKALKDGDKEKSVSLSNEKKRKYKAEEMLGKMEDYFELSQMLTTTELEKKYLLVELGAEHRQFAIQHGPVPIRQIADFIGLVYNWGQVIK